MKRDNFLSEQTAFMRRTQNEFAGLHQAINQLRDNAIGLQRPLKIPVPRGGSRYSKAIRDNSTGLLQAGGVLGGIFANGLISEAVGGSGAFYISASQSAALWNDVTRQGQRIR